MAHNLMKQVRNLLSHRTGTKFKSLRTLISNTSISSSELIKKEKTCAAHNYDPIPVVISKAEGVWVWDPEGNKYLDCLAGFATLNTGHCHPKIMITFIEQAMNLHHTSRAFYNNVFPEYAEMITNMFGYDKILPMNTGNEGGEGSVKIARRWAYLEKKIPENQAVILFPEGNFWGRSLSAVSTSTNPTTYKHFGPYTPGFKIIPYNDLSALEEAVKNPNVCAYFMEPIQGEAGVIVPNQGYLKEVRRLCTENNVLWIADEIQTGLGRTGALLACDYEDVRPDLLILGKALSGGFTPVSAILGNDNVIKVMTPGTHGSTFGGNPLGSRLAITTLRVLKEEGLIENAAKQGITLRKELAAKLPREKITEIRGKGLMNAIEINPDYGSAWNFCLKLKDQGLLTKPCENNIVRLTPPLTISESEIHQAVDIIAKVVNSLPKEPSLT